MEAINNVSRINLRHGAAFMVVGFLWGAAIGAAPFPRLALGAHIQFTTSGVMFVVAGLLIAHLGIGRIGAQRAILAYTPWAVWVMALSEAANAWWGASKMLPIAAAQAGATGAAPWQEAIVSIAHVIGALAILVYWIVLLVALCRQQRDLEPA
jgi:hydroxylaminobenzene mutase